MNRMQAHFTGDYAHQATLGYRKDIDGLRAVAVLPVLLYHAFPKAVPGGFYGVDIFFVISGFLITGIIHRQMLSKTFRIADFYARRIRRIFPALITVVLVVLAAGWLVLPPRELKSLGTNIAGGAIFAQNFVLLGQVGYFDLAADVKPLLHLWSLGIEEQYYIVWPLLLISIGAWPKKSFAITATLGAASFVAFLIARHQAPDYAFYLPFTRAWELLIGSGLALRLNARPIGAADARPSRRFIYEIIALAALLVIVAAFEFQGRRFPLFRHYQFSLVITVVAAAALIATSGTRVHRYVLSAAPLVAIGLISYPLYLWHFPPMAYARIIFAGNVSQATMWSILVASFPLAWLTYRFIERPIRHGRGRNVIRVGALVGCMAMVGVAGFMIDNAGGAPSRIPEGIRGFMLDGSETGFRWRAGKCLLLPEQSAADFAPECAGNGRRPLVAIWGDSYSASLYPGLLHFGGERGFDIAEFTASSCPPLMDYVNSTRRFCKPANDFVIERLIALKPDLVIFYSTWTFPQPVIQDGLEKTVSRLKDAGVTNMVLLGPTASWLGEGLPANLLNYYFVHRTLMPARTWYRSNDAWTKPLDEFLSGQADRNGIQYVSVRQMMCNDDGCLARIGPDGRDLTAYDNGHFTYPGALFVAERLLDAVRGLNR